MIYFDLTSTMTYIGRNPVGIVRVEMKLAQYALDNLTPQDITFCYYDLTLKKISYLAFSDAQGVLNSVGHTVKVSQPESPSLPEVNAVSWIEKCVSKGSKVINSVLRALNDSQNTQSISSPQAKNTKSTITSKAAEPYDVNWNENDIFVTVGLIWDIWQTSRIYETQKIRKFQVITMIYDLIPYKVPEFCRGVPGEFFQTVCDMLWCSTKIITISNSTSNDLHDFIKTYDLPSPKIISNILGMDISVLLENFTPPSSEIDISKIQKGRFILQVGTMEPRKNHQLIYNAYRYLVNQGHKDKLIPWVIVGAQAWGMNDLVESIKLNKDLYPDLIVFSNHASDETLSWLYHNCAFTVYPSYYEGWGLPVSESLAFGKLCLTGTNSALGEAAGENAEMRNPFDTVAWANRLLELMTNREYVNQKNTSIRENYHIRSWNECGQDFFKLIQQD